ncbi:MAG: redoxin family protein [Fimbriimonadales bacterium]
MLIAQVAAVFAVGMPFPGAIPGSAMLVSSTQMQPPTGVRFVLSAGAQGTWLVNNKGYLIREFAKGADIVDWLKGSSLPTGYVAPDPRKTVTPVPIVKSPQSWLDVVAIGMSFAVQKREVVTTENGLLVLFMSTYGPVDHLYAERINQVGVKAKEAGVSVIALFSGRDENRILVTQFVARHAFGFPCAVDPGNAYADAFRATRTPEAFLLDSKLRVVYAGAIDDNTFGTESATPYLLTAISDFASGQQVRTSATRVFGTPIDR